jgi:hypothetical protein
MGPADRRDTVLARDAIGRANGRRLQSECADHLFQRCISLLPIPHEVSEALFHSGVTIGTQKLPTRESDSDTALVLRRELLFRWCESRLRSNDRTIALKRISSRATIALSVGRITLFMRTITLPAAASRSPSHELLFRSTICTFGRTICSFGRMNCTFGRTICSFGRMNCTLGRMICSFGRMNCSFGRTICSFDGMN